MYLAKVLASITLSMIQNVPMELGIFITFSICLPALKNAPVHPAPSVGLAVEVHLGGSLDKPRDLAPDPTLWVWGVTVKIWSACR